MAKASNQRRDFIRKSTLSGLGALGGASLLGACKEAAVKDKADININFNKSYQWIMVTTWPPKFPVLGEGLDLMAGWIKTASGGRMEIKVMGSGELIPPLECFDAVSQGAAQMASSVSYYWAGKLPAAQFFAAIPFGMNAQQMNAWIINGGGLALWEELYAEHDLLPIPGEIPGYKWGDGLKRKLKISKI
ncbi:MAG: hypothetical protein AAFU64_13545 [Bacteroidota bacterium]